MKTSGEKPASNPIRKRRPRLYGHVGRKEGRGGYHQQDVKHAVQVQRIHGNTHKTFTSEDWFVGEDMDTVRVGLRHCEAPL